MMRVRSGALVAVMFIVGCAVGGAASRLLVQTAAAQTIKRWDYLCFEELGAKEIMAKAKRVGAEGWEMVVADSVQTRQVVCFKRPL
jgi:hypothetical protein